MSEQPLGPLMIDVADISLNAEDKELLKHPLVGGLILFSRNFNSAAQVTELIRDVRRIRSNILIAVDQEGGRVQRFRDEHFAMPAAEEFGVLYQRDKQQAIQQLSQAALRLSQRLVVVGIDINFTPVLDVDRGNSDVLRTRCFHQDIDCITELALCVMMAMRQAGMQACAKHFPGHGGVSADTHLQSAIDTRTLPELEQADLKPFIKLIQLQLKALMLAHVSFPEVDAGPVCFSEIWLKQLLRKRYQYRGAIFSDDLSMQAVAADYDVAERVKLALAAGCDMVLLCNQREDVMTVLEQKPLMKVTDNPRLNSLRAGGK